jgi:hypothetical protein
MEDHHLPCSLKDIVINKTRRKGRCSNRGCDNKASGVLCGSCRSRKCRINDPVRYAFNNIKNRAKQRDIFFDLTLEQFRKFCVKTEYMKKKGRFIGSFDVDRKIEGKYPGYTYNNLKTEDKLINIRKYYDHNVRKTFRRK